jgi:hypothetical protein
MDTLALVIAASCSWANPGADRFSGDPAAAVAHYADIPPAAMARLQRRIAAHDFDRIVSITRDEIEGFEPRIFDMHFGTNRMCHEVDRSAWPADKHERGMVYCEDGRCILVPVVCGNVSRIKPLSDFQVAAEAFDLKPMSPDFVALDVPQVELEPGAATEPPPEDPQVPVEPPPWWEDLFPPWEEPPEERPPIPEVPEPPVLLNWIGGLIVVALAVPRLRARRRLGLVHAP